MKQKFLSGLMVLALAPAAFGRASDIYENWALVQAPPEIPPTIDASNFVNHAQFFINFTNAFGFVPVTVPPFETWDTSAYTNDFGAVMSCNTGFRMENRPQSGVRKRASAFFNNGAMECGTLGTSNVIIIGGIFFITGTGAGVKCIVNATNIVNPGTIDMAYDSLLTLSGDNIDLTRGTLAMENTGFTGLNGNIFFNGGFFDGYWGFGDPVHQRPLYYPGGITPEFYFGTSPPITPIYIVTNRDYTVTLQSLGGPSFSTYLADETDLLASNRTVRVVFLSNTNPAVTAQVFLPPGSPLVFAGWSSTITNTQGISTNFLYFEDDFGATTNFGLTLNGFAGFGFNRPTYIPTNYFFASSSTPLFLGPPSTATNLPLDTFFPGAVTNQWEAYQARFLPESVVLSDTAGQNPTNLPGRIELRADKFLELSQAQISSVDYILLKATNQFGGSSGAQIAAPYLDIYLRTTNGLMNITNVVLPSIPRPIGTCDFWSARWTNYVAGITNEYHILFVDTKFAPTSPILIQTLNLRSTNTVTHDDSIYIRDVFNVTSSLLIDTLRLTLTTNAPDSLTPVGTINYLNPSILWPAATPRLQYLTNYGIIGCANLVVFGGSQSSPYTPPASSTNPYAAFVNAGSVANFGSTIFARYFQNSGTFSASGGAIQLRQAQTAILTNGAFLAPASSGVISIGTGSLLVSNHLLQAGNSLILTVTNRLDDGSLTNSVDTIAGKNTWYAGYGFDLPVRPAAASLLATTITNLGPAGKVITNLWAGAEAGRWGSAYTSNAAVGRLILDGITNSQFYFVRAGPTNAIYVDYLEFKDYSTNRDNAGNYIGVRLDTNFTVYYAQAVANGVSVAEKLNGKRGVTGAAGGQFVWVSSYAGYYSSTTVTNPDGTTYQANAALRFSTDLDSDYDGIANASDPTPFLTPATVRLAATLTNSPKRIALSWSTLPYSTNFVYYKPSVTTASSWQLLTNFVYNSPVAGRTQVVDPLGAGGRYYRVGVNAAQP